MRAPEDKDWGSEAPRALERGAVPEDLLKEIYHDSPIFIVRLREACML